MEEWKAILQDMPAVRQAIQRGPGEAFAAEEFGPVFERQVGGHDQAVAFVVLLSVDLYPT